MLERVASCFGLSLVIIVKAEHGRLDEGVEGPSLFFGGASRASCSVDETADAAHLQKFILLGIRDVFVDLRNEFGANTLFDTSQNAERVGDGRFFHADDLSLFNNMAWLYVGSVYGHTAVLDSIHCQGACFINTCCPKPFVDAGRRTVLRKSIFHTMLNDE